MKAIVTGHSRGLGEAVAAELLARGISVMGISRSRRAAKGGRAATGLEEVQLDLSDSAALIRWLADKPLSRFFERADAAFLINNAGLLQPIGPLQTQDVAEVASAVTVNVAAPLMLSAAFVAQTPEVANRRILHVSSGAGLKPYAGWAVYCATKAALDHHARCVVEDKSAALRICSVAPGLVDTEMQSEIRATSLEQFPQRGRFEEFQKSGQLRRPAAVAARLVDYLVNARFGSEPVVDLHAEAPRG